MQSSNYYANLLRQSQNYRLTLVKYRAIRRYSSKPKSKNISKKEATSSGDQHQLFRPQYEHHINKSSKLLSDNNGANSPMNRLTGLINKLYSKDLSDGGRSTKKKEKIYAGSSTSSSSCADGDQATTTPAPFVSYRPMKERFLTKQHPQNENFWSSVFVLDNPGVGDSSSSSDVTTPTTPRTQYFASMKYGDAGNYYVEEDTGVVWYPKKSLAEHAAAAAALNSLEATLPHELFTNNDNTGSLKAQQHHQQMAKIVRRIHTQRKEVSTAIGLIMLDDLSFFRTTMSAALGSQFDATLIVSDGEEANGIHSTRGDGNATKSDSIIHKSYRQMFESAVPIFCELLGRNPSAIDIGNELTVQHFLDEHSEPFSHLKIPMIDDLIRKHVSSYSETENLLDRMAGVGFAHTKFSKQYREARGNVDALRKIDALLEDKTRLLRERELQLNEVKLDYARKEREYKMSKYEKEAVDEEFDDNVGNQKVDNATNGSFLSNVIGSLSSLLSLKSANNTAAPAAYRDDSIGQEDGQIETKRRVRRERRIALGEVRNLLKLRERAVYNASISIKRAKNLKQKLDVVSEKKDLKRAEEVVSQIMNYLTPAFAAHFAESHERLIAQYSLISEHTDLTSPHEWFMHTRLDRRKIIFHGGPTNSGKTYMALESLKTANKGIYLGPLRLLVR